MISIVIPTYNSEKHLERAIRSALDQTYQDFEIIIIDDGSTDKTKEAVKKFTDERIRYIYQENQGVSAARNRGIELSKGEYIAFLDADDYWSPEKLEIQSKILDEQKDICLVFSNILMIDTVKGLKFVKSFKNYSDRKTLIKNLAVIPMNSVPSPCTVLARKGTLLEAGLFNSELSIGEDRDLWIRMAYLGNFYCVNKTLAGAVRVKDGLTRSTDLKKTLEFHLRILDRFFNETDTKGEFTRYRSKAYAFTHLNIGFHYFFSGPDKTPSKSNIFTPIKNSLFMLLKSLIRFTVNVYAKLI